VRLWHSLLTLRLSENGTIRRWMETSPTADRLTSRFVAGHSIEHEIAAIERLNRDARSSPWTISAKASKREEAAKTRDPYLGILDLVAIVDAGATLSIKLTQLGLGISTDRRICARAKGHRVPK
jgi:proline dehydrogenase